VCMAWCSAINVHQSVEKFVHIFMRLGVLYQTSRSAAAGLYIQQTIVRIQIANISCIASLCIHSHRHT
jgi:hypothetical protein